MSIQLEDGNVVTVVTLYVQHETSNEFWGVYKNKGEAINNIKLFMEESNEISFMEDPEFDREFWVLIGNEENHQVWKDKNSGHEKKFYFQRWGL